MLRMFLLLVAIALLVGGIAGTLCGIASTAPLAIWGLVLLVATLIERWRYGRNALPRGPGWEKTEERFIDPETGDEMQVWYHPGTGERRYVPQQKH